MCRNTSDTVVYTGWVMKVAGQVKIDSTGKIQQVGPVRAITTIKKGHELEGKLTEVSCQRCNYVGPYKTFTLIRVCALTGTRATGSITTKYGEIPISDDVAELAVRIFNNAALEGISPLRAEMIADV